MNLEMAQKIVSEEFHPTSGFSKDDPTLCEAKGFLDGWNARGKKDAEIARKHFCKCCGESGCVDCCDCTGMEILALDVAE